MRKLLAILAVLLTVNSFNFGARASIPDLDKSVFWNITPPADFNKPLISKATFDHYMPTNLVPTTNQAAFGQDLGNKVGQKIADDLMNDYFKKSGPGKMVANVQQMTNTSWSLGSAEPGHTVHTFKFQLKAMERYAQLDYTGFFKSSVVYNSGANTTAISITQPLKKDLNLSFTGLTNMGVMDFNPNIVLTYNF